MAGMVPVRQIDGVEKMQYGSNQLTENFFKDLRSSRGFRCCNQLLKLIVQLNFLKLIYSFSCDGSFSVFFYAYALPFYGVFFFYQKAYFRMFLKII
jgi:hypothetical protein